MAAENLKDAPRDRNVELPGDTNSADIVGRTGEEMPLQRHDGIESNEAERRSRANEERLDPVRADDDNPGGGVAD